MQIFFGFCCKPIPIIYRFVSSSCLEISIADVATTVLERPFSCLEILVHTTDSGDPSRAATAPPRFASSKERADARKTSSREEVDFRQTLVAFGVSHRFQVACDLGHLRGHFSDLKSNSLHFYTSFLFTHIILAYLQTVLKGWVGFRGHFCDQPTSRPLEVRPHYFTESYQKSILL